MCQKKPEKIAKDDEYSPTYNICASMTYFPPNVPKKHPKPKKFKSSTRQKKEVEGRERREGGERERLRGERERPLSLY